MFGGTATVLRPRFGLGSNDRTTLRRHHPGLLDPNRAVEKVHVASLERQHLATPHLAPRCQQYADSEPIGHLTRDPVHLGYRCHWSLFSADRPSPLDGAWALSQMSIGDGCVYDSPEEAVAIVGCCLMVPGEAVVPGTDVDRFEMGQFLAAQYRQDVPPQQVAVLRPRRFPQVGPAVKPPSGVRLQRLFAGLGVDPSTTAPVSLFASQPRVGSALVVNVFGALCQAPSRK
jgi:hypothetical protein